MRQLQENAAQLRTIYAGEKAEAILVREQEVMEAWKELLSSCEASRVQVTSVTDKVQFFSVVRENLMWMEGIMGQIGWDEPRYDSWLGEEGLTSYIDSLVPVNFRAPVLSLGTEFYYCSMWHKAADPHWFIWTSLFQLVIQKLEIDLVIVANVNLSYYWDSFTDMINLDYTWVCVNIISAICIGTAKKKERFINERSCNHFKNYLAPYESKLGFQCSFIEHITIMPYIGCSTFADLLSFVNTTILSVL